MRTVRTVASLLALSVFMFAALAAQARATENITVQQAYEQAGKGELVLVDIRSRDEWRETGIATVAEPISMHEDGFLARLDALLSGDRGRAVALICATGSRSAWLQVQLLARGYSHIINVPEGMLGSRSGPGWIKAGLPVRPFAK